MNSKVPCEKCGVMILPTTAEGTGGICMPCDKGEIEDIEESLEWYKNWRETVKIETDIEKILQSLPEENKLWAGLWYASEQVMGLGIPSENSIGEAHCIEILQKLVSTYGYTDVYACLKEHDSDGMGFLYWFARAGISQAIPELENYLASDDVDDVFDAAISLALLNDDRGLATIEKLCAGEHRLKLEEIPDWYLDEYIQEIDDPRAREIEGKYCKQSLSSQDSSPTRSNAMTWETLIDTKEEQFFRGIVFRFPAQYPFESVVDFMITRDPDSPAEYSLICSTGHHAGDLELQLPEESMHGDGGLSVQWFKDNWQKWVYKDCKVEDVTFINQYRPQIGE